MRPYPGVVCRILIEGSRSMKKMATFSHMAFFNKFSFWNFIQTYPMIVLESQIVNMSALVQIMAWRRFGDKPIPEQMLRPLTPYVVTSPQCVKTAIHYSDVKMGAMASQITSLTIVYSTVYSGADQRKHHSSASMAFVRGIHRSPVNSPHKWPVT